MTLLRIDSSWLGLGGVFGGKIIAETIRVAGAHPEVADLSVASAYVSFLGTVTPGEVDFATRVTHRGRRTATVDVAVVQGRDLATGRVKLAVAGAEDLCGPARLKAFPGPEDVEPYVAPYGALAHDEHLEVRPFSTVPDEGVPSVRAWVRARVGAGLGVGTAAALLDIVPPSLFFSGHPPTFVPTIDFHLHRQPRDEDLEGQWLLAEARTEWADGALCAETTTLHRPDGTFLARGTQTRRIVRD
ncbi:thioesterase family protein [Nocardioides gilvus]|uniref:thioesterase family protein n=1 Tax=Nocardioides gilvus TaxID=1735589 RepID=UPI0013A53D2E|nr:thioesterase family protein [Nocardioides gilvus]